MTPTARPWEAVELRTLTPVYRSQLVNGGRAAIILQHDGSPEGLANEAHIVHCVNTHDALVDGLAYLVHVIGEANVPGNIMATLEQARKESA